MGLRRTSQDDVVKVFCDTWYILQDIFYGVLENSWCRTNPVREAIVTEKSLVFTVAYFFDLLSSGSCEYAWLESSLLNRFSPFSFSHRSSMVGMGYCSRCETIHSQLVVTAHPHLAIRFENWNYRSCPIGVPHWLHHVSLHQPVQLLHHFFSHGVGNRSCLEELGSFSLIHVNLCGKPF